MVSVSESVSNFAHPWYRYRYRNRPDLFSGIGIVIDTENPGIAGSCYILQPIVLWIYVGNMGQEPAIPGFSVSITILIPKKGLDDFDTDFDTQGWAKFDTDSDTDTKTLQML